MAIHVFSYNPAIEFNTSLQIGDVVYICPTAQVGGFDTADELAQGGSEIIRIGTLDRIDTPRLSGNNPTRISRLYVDDEGVAPAWTLEGGVGDFLMFSKDNKVNLNSIAGYYANVKMTNNTSGTAVFNEPELFAVSAEVTQSSK